MFSEINAAVNFLSNFLFDKLPRRKINLFSQQLANFLVLRYKSTWSPGEPYKGTEMRRIQIKVHGGITDSLVSVTASNVGLEMDEILQSWPDELTIWVDPGEVTYRIGERGPATVIYSASEGNNSLLNRLLSQGSTGLSATNGNALRLNLPDQIEQLTLAVQHAQLQDAMQQQPPIVAQQQQQQQQQATVAVGNNNSGNAAGNNNNGNGNGGGGNMAPTFELSTPNDIQFTVGSFAMTRFGTTKVKNTPAALNRLRQKNRNIARQFGQGATSDSQFRQFFGGHHSSSSPSLLPSNGVGGSFGHMLGQSRVLTAAAGNNNSMAGSSPSFCPAPGSSRPFSFHFDSVVANGNVGMINLGASVNSSPNSSNRGDDSDVTCSPANDINSPLFGLPPIRPGGVWSDF